MNKLKGESDLSESINSLAIAKGLKSDSYEVLRYGTNIVLASAKNKVVVRVTQRNLKLDSVQHTLNLCTELATKGAPLLTPLYDKVDVLANGQIITFWPLADKVQSLRGGEYASLMNACRQVPLVEGLPTWTTEIRLQQRYEDLDKAISKGMPMSVHDLIKELTIKTVAKVNVAVKTALESADDYVFCHGDFYYANVVRYQGKLLLCDPDNLCWAPAEVDIAHILVDCQHIFQDMSIWSDFIANYSYDYDSNLVDILKDWQMIGELSWYGAYWDNPKYRQEVLRRLDNLDNPNFRMQDF